MASFRYTVKTFFNTWFTDKKIIISSEKALKTINIPRSYQIVLASIVAFFVLVFIVFFAFGLNLYGKVDKKQRKIDQMNQDTEFAKGEIKNMIQYMDEVSEYFTKIKKLSNPPKNVSKAKLLESEDGDDVETSIEIKSDEEPEVFVGKIEIEEGLIKKKTSNEIENSPSSVSNIDFKSIDSSTPDGIKSLVNTLTVKIDNLRDILAQRYYYIYSILDHLNIADCENVSWFSKAFAKAEDAIERFSSSEKATSSTLKRLKNKICANGVIQKMSQSYAKLKQKDINSDIAFIKSLSNLESMIVKMPLGMPIKNVLRFSSSFGYRRDPVHGRRAFHSGQDLVAKYGTSIISTGSGVVTKAGWFSGYGWCVDVAHDFGMSTRYAHLSAINVHVGQVVHPNSLLGNEGNSGKSTGAHLHYEIRINNLAINPRGFMLINR